MKEITQEEIGRAPYPIFDILKPYAHIYDMSVRFNGRIADNRTPMPFRWVEGRVPKNLEGLHAFIEGQEGHGHYDKKHDRIVMEMDAYPVRWEGDGTEVRSGGFTILRLPDKFWGKEGLFSGYIGLKDENGVTVTSVDVWFKILGGIPTMGIAAKYFITDFDKAMAEAQGKIDDALRILRERYQAEVKKNEDMSAQTRASLSELENSIQIYKARVEQLYEKIASDDIVQRPELDKKIGDAKTELTELINNKANKAYDTVADMQHDTKLETGNTVQTLGYHSRNDGGGSVYRILDQADGFSIQLDNGKWAQQINITDNNYYGNISYSIDRDHSYHTTCYTVTIPKTDFFGEQIMPEMNYHQNWISPNAWARQYHTTLTLNGDASIRIGPGETYMNGNIISGGRIIHEADPSKTYPDRMKSLAIMADRSIREYPANGTTAQQMLNDGAKVAFTVYYPLVKNGQKSGYADTDNELSDNLRAGGRVTDHYPAMGIGEKADGTWIIIGTDGRRIDENGLTADELAQKFINAGCVNAWRMDGGGSESINYRGSKLNQNYDDNGLTDRALQWTFDIRKPTAADNGNSYAMAGTGEQKLNLFRQIMYPVNTFLLSSFAILGNRKVNNEDELNSFLDEVAWKLNESQMTQGAHLSGILTVTYQNSGIAQALGYPTMSGDFLWDYTCTAGNHNTGMFTVKNVNTHQFQAYKQFTKLQENHWSQWFATNQTVDVSGANPGSNISDFHIQRINNTIEFQCKIHADSNTWKTYITGLPLPKYNGLSLPVFGEGQNKIGFVNVDKGGKLNMRADTNDTYNFHYTYLAKNVDYDIPY